jgi:WD40 repeat protein
MTGSSVTSSGGPKVVPSPWQSTTKNERINRKDNQTHSNTSNDDSFTTLSRVTPAAGYPGPLIRVTPTPRKLRIDPDNDQNLHKGLDDDDVIRPVLPPLDRTLRRQLRTPTSLLTSSSSPTFAVNEECTSLQFSPSGRLLVAGFTDGTVRLFDLTGRYPTVWTESGKGMSTSNVSRGLVDSNHFQKHGAVACQIHAKGVHTSLLMDVDVSPDGLWCFAGVLRGSMELLAVHLGALEASYDARSPPTQPPQQDTLRRLNTTNNKSNGKHHNHPNLLDHVTVYRHQDAKLRGFGACTKLQTKQPKYLLFTGKAIKNIHIWSFEPPRHPQAEPRWTQLYDTNTNGNTIKLLQFRHDPLGNLQGVSKSDGQKLRVWDLRPEEKSTSKPRLARPKFVDVAHTEATLGVAGGYCLCGGSEWYNQMSVVHLDVDRQQLHSPYNHTEIALPGTNAPSIRSSRRPQRGDLKCIQAVSGMVADAGRVLLELSDGTVLQYAPHADGGLPRLQPLPGIAPLAEGDARKISVGRVAAERVALAAVATYHPATGHGTIQLLALDPLPPESRTLPVGGTPQRRDVIVETTRLVVPENRTSPSGVTVSPVPPRVSPKLPAVVQTPRVPVEKAGNETPVPQRTLDSALQKVQGMHGAGASGQPSTTSAVPPTAVRVPEPARPHKYRKAEDGGKVKAALQQPQRADAPVREVRLEKPNQRTLDAAVRKAQGTHGVGAPGQPSTTSAVPPTAVRVPEPARPHKYRKADDDGGKVKAPPRQPQRADDPVRGAPLRSEKLNQCLDRVEVAAVPLPVTAIATKPTAPTLVIPRKRSVVQPVPSSVEPNLLTIASALYQMGAVDRRNAAKAQTDPSARRVSPTPPVCASPKPTAKAQAPPSGRGPGRPRKDDPALHPLIREYCVHQQTIVLLELSKITRSRFAAEAAVESDETTGVDVARRRLASHQAAEHAQLAKRILQATLRELETVAHEPSVAIWIEAKLSLETSVGSYLATAEDVRGRHELEAESLAAQLGQTAAHLFVAFPYQHVFELAGACFATLPSLSDS